MSIELHIVTACHLEVASIVAEILTVPSHIRRPQMEITFFFFFMICLILFSIVL